MNNELAILIPIWGIAISIALTVAILGFKHFAGWKAILFPAVGEPALRNVDNVGKMDLVLKALVFKNQTPNGGGATVVYDKELNRLFYSSSHR